jgi:hypothetical protein
MKNPNSPGGPEGGKFLPMSVAPTPPTSEAQQVVQLQGTADTVVTSQTISIIPGICDFTLSIIKVEKEVMIGESRSTLRILAGKYLEKQPFGRPKLCEGDIKMVPRKTGCGDWR